VCLLAVFGGAGCRLPSRTEKPQNQTENSNQSFSYDALYDEVSPSVVTIYSNFGPEMLYDPNVGASSGSGVIFRKDGYIITNYHVVADDNFELIPSIEVALDNGKTYVAKIMGTDPLNDIAIIKIEEDDLPTSKLGTVDSLKIGDPVFVIGSPGAGADLMLSTLTSGIVSAKDRTFQGIIRLQPNLVQIDAAINPGNSGGPVYNTEGEVIGIATLRDPETQNIGFAVPIDVAKRSADEIIKTGSLKRGWIGVDTVTINRVMARAYQFDANQGAVVVYVYLDGPAAKGAVQRGDVITAVDGKALKSNTQLEDIIFKKKIGDSMELKINRFGEQISINLIVEEIPTGALE
jgi:S1-C subfamily serine protease